MRAWLLLSCYAALVNCSLGDQDEDYKECVKVCQEKQKCNLTWNLRLLQWTCLDECRYQCMQEIVSQYRRMGLAPWQYHGKWPFERWWGIQEPASVIFSWANGMAHWLGWKFYGRNADPKGWMHNVVRGMMLTALGAWSASTIFHTRDTSLTEKCDYFGAAGHLLYALYLTIVRMSRLKSLKSLLLIPFVIFWLYHIWGLSKHFDYGWNMTVMVIIGMSFNVIWLVWAIRHWNLRHARWMACWTILGTSAGLLELLDFPPMWGLLDAHAIWHLITIPLNYWLYVIWSADSWAEREDRALLLLGVKSRRSRV